MKLLEDELIDAAKISLQDYDPEAILKAGPSALTAAEKKVENDIKSGLLESYNTKENIRFREDLKTTKPEDIKKATEDALKALAIEQASNEGTMSNSEATTKILDKYKKEESIINTYTRTREDIEDSLGLSVAMNSFAETGVLDSQNDDLEIARSYFSDIDELYHQLIDETLDENDFLDILLEAQVPEEIILSLIESALNINNSEDSNEDIDPSYFQPTDDMIAMAYELSNRGLSSSDLIDYLVQKFDISEHDSNIIVETLNNSETSTPTKIEESEPEQISSDVLVSGGQDVTDEWEQRFETAIDEFEGNTLDTEEPYAEDDLYDFLYKKFNVPEDIACSILSSTNMNVPKAVIILCEHCRESFKK